MPETKFELSSEDEKTIFAVFPNNRSLKKAMVSLKKREIPSDRISIMVSHKGNLLDDRKESKFGEGILWGVGCGALIGALISWTMKIRVPGADAALWSIFGIAAVGGMIGGVIGALLGLMVPEYEVERYETSLDHGKILVRVRALSQAQSREIKNVLRALGGSVVIPEEIIKKAS